MKISLITGSTKGIGLATAHRLYDNGDTVILNSVETDGDKVLDEFDDKSRVSYCAADISDKNALQRLRDFILDKYGRLDCLVANAGVMPLPVGIDDITDENIDRTINVNQKGTFNTLKILGSLIQETSSVGSIVTLSSVDGIIGEPYGAIYSSTKAGVISLTKSFARKYKNPLVRVNSIAPGLIDTSLSASTGEDPSWTTDVSVIQRIGNPEEIASVVSFLLSDDASFITGQILAVDGGFTLK